MATSSSTAATEGKSPVLWLVVEEYQEIYRAGNIADKPYWQHRVLTLSLQ